MLLRNTLQLGRAAAAGLRSSTSLAGSGAPSVAASAEHAGASGSGGWRRLWKAAGCTTQVAPLHSSQDEGDEASKARGLHTYAAPLMAALQQEGSTFNDLDATAREAGRSTSGGAGPGASREGEGSGGYTLLSAAHAGLAAAAFVAPTAIANFLFPGAALPQGFQSQALVKLLGCGVGAGAAAAFGLKQLTDAGQLASPTAQRLQLGLMGFSAGNIALHALYSPQITTSGLLTGAAVMGLTFYVPYQHYVKTNGGLKVIEAIKSYFGAVPDHLNITGPQSGMYALLTPVLAAAGAAYLFVPGLSLMNVFGFVKGVDTFFLWQAMGGGLLTVAPAITYSLKKLADGGRLNEPIAKTLNAGILAAAVGHLAVMAPMVAANQGGPWLSMVAGAWATALLASGLGLMGGGAAAAKTAGRV